MGKKNTVRIDMNIFNQAIRAAGYTSPKKFCEQELGFSNGWYYTVRKGGGRGVKVLVAELIARRLGIDIEALVIPDKDGNPSVSEADSSFCTREPVETEEWKKSVAELFQTAARTFEEIAEYYAKMGCSE